MGIISTFVKRTGKYRALEETVAKQKAEIQELKAERKAIRAETRQKLEDFKADLPRLYPHPRLLLARPRSADIAGRLLELTGQVVLGRISRRMVLVDWRENGRNVFWDWFQPSLTLPRTGLREADCLVHTRTAPELPVDSAPEPQELAEWVKVFSHTHGMNVQMVIAPGDLGWRERLPGAWLPELTLDGQITLDDLERMTLLSLWRPRKPVRERVGEVLRSHRPTRTLAVYLPAGAELPVGRICEELVRRGLENIWLWSDSAATREAARAEWGDLVLCLPVDRVDVVGLLASYQLLSLPNFQFHAARTSEARLVYLLSGIRPADATWL